MDDDLEGEYWSRELPALSKSRLKTWDFCPYLFWKEIILGEESKKLVRTIVGTNAHLIFASFFKEFDIEYVYDVVELNPLKNLENNDLTNYFYSICMSMVPETDREVEAIKRVLWKFALLEAGHFYYLYTIFNTSKTKIKKYFIPKGIEEHIWIPNLQLYGTIDRIMESVYKDETTIDYIADYKTGHVPASVKRGLKKVGDETSWDLPTRFMFEIHFYMFIYLLGEGWEVTEKLSRLMNNNEYFEDGEWKRFGLGMTEEEEKQIDKKRKKYITSLKDDYKLRIFDPEDNRYKLLEKGDILGGIIYLATEQDPETPKPTKKKFNYRSFKTIVNAIALLREVLRNLKNDDYFLVRNMKQRPEYDHWKCTNCSRNEICLKESEESE